MDQRGNIAQRRSNVLTSAQGKQLRYRRQNHPPRNFIDLSRKELSISIPPTSKEIKSPKRGFSFFWRFVIEATRERRQP